MGTPCALGSSQATALTRVTSSGGKTARSARSPLILEPFEPRFAEASSPATHRLPAHAQPLADLDVALALGRQKHQLRALHLPMGPGVAGGAALELDALCVAQHDLVGASSGHRTPDSPPLPSLLQAWRDFRRRALSRESEAREAFEDLAVNDFADLPQDEEWLYSLSLLAEVAEFLRDARRAATLYELLLPHSGLNAVNAPIVSTGAVARPLGVLAATMNQWGEAARHFDSALAINSKMGARPWVAHTQHDYARMLSSRDEPGDLQEARELLSQALANYHELGMEMYAARASVLAEKAT